MNTDGFLAPQRFEADVLDCEVRGHLPTDLNGALVRVGGNWYQPPMYPGDAAFNDDGYISRFRFKNGRVDYKGRWIQTPRFLNNRAAGRQLYGNYRNPYTDDPLVRNVGKPYLRTVANTAPVVHAGKLFAVKEDSVPYEIDPQTLATRGPWDFAGKYKSQTFTAHPKRDPISGELIAYGYEATESASDDLWVYVIDPHGHVRREIRLKVPYVSMVHDIALTQQHIVIPVFGYVTSLERLEQGKVHWGWDPSAPTLIGILPRDGEPSDLRWFKGPTRAIVHTSNARTEGSRVILEAPVSNGSPFPFFPALDGSAWEPSRARAYLRRMTFDLASTKDSYSEEIVFSNPSVVDLVRIDERFASLDSRYVFTHFHDAARAFDEDRAGPVRRPVSNCYGRFDMKTGAINSLFAGDCHGLQECCFVPRGTGSNEGDGYLLGVANNYRERRSELIIADAQRLGDGEIARIILPFRSDVQVHCKWVAEAELDLGWGVTGS